jgi:hypothetical protein
MISSIKIQLNAAARSKLNELPMPNEFRDRSYASRSSTFLKRLDLNNRTPDNQGIIGERRFLLALSDLYSIQSKSEGGFQINSSQAAVSLATRIEFETDMR